MALRRIRFKGFASRPSGSNFPVCPFPVILAVDGDELSLRDVERELDDRYSRSYRVFTAPRPSEATVALEELAAAGEDVARRPRLAARLDLTEASELFRRVPIAPSRTPSGGC